MINIIYGGSRVFIDDEGLSRCGNCGEALECNEFGEMPDVCPVCCAVLDYDHIDDRKEATPWEK